MEKKKMCDVYLSCSRKDTVFGDRLTEALMEMGVSVYVLEQMLGSGNYAEQVAEAIRSAKIFIPVVTEHMIRSEMCMNELFYAIELAKSRSKIVLPVCFSCDVIRQSDVLSFCLSRYQVLTVKNDSREEVKRLAEEIAQKILVQKTENTLYEKTAEYIRIGAVDRAVPMLCQLVINKCGKIENSGEESARRTLLRELLLLLQKLDDLYDYDYSPEAKKLADNKLEAINAVGDLMKSMEFLCDDLYRVAVAIRLIWFDRRIRYACIDAATHGDLSDGIIQAVPVASYREQQKPYLERYHQQMKRQRLSEKNHGKYTDSEWEVIGGTLGYIYGDEEPKPIRVSEKGTLNKDDQLLHAVASFMREGNKVFDMISEDQMAEEFIRCLILSYERLKAYCEVVGETTVCAECVDRIQELKEKLNSVEKNSAASEKVQNGIKTLLGLTVPKSGRFDVFISHKKEDMDIASDMYTFLKKNMKEAFFDKYSLPQMSKSQYRQAIMQALDGSEHFVVVLSDLSYLKSDWIQLEMEVFHAEIDEGRKPNSNFIIVVTGNVYDQIMKSNKSVLPIDYRRCEIMRVDEYPAKLLSYLQ